MSRHISTPEERQQLIDAGWSCDRDDWWWPDRQLYGWGRTAREALREMDRKRKRSQREPGKGGR